MRAEPSASEVRAGLLADRPEALERVRGWISGLVRTWRLRDPEAATQDILLRLVHLGREGRIRDDTDFKAFVFTVARHGCTDLYRKERLRGSVETAAGEEHADTSGGDPESLLRRRERRELLAYVLQALPRECRRLWRWIYGEGLAHGDVAARLGITAGNARVRVHRCLQRARSIRERYELGGSRGGP